MTKLLKKMESQHLSAAEDLEKIYEQKIENEGKKLLELERKMYLERMNQQKKIQRIAETNLKEVRNVKKESEMILIAQQGIEEETQQELDKMETHFFGKFEDQERQQAKIRAMDDEEHKRREIALESGLSRLKSENESYRRVAKKAALSEQESLEKMKIFEDKLRIAENKVFQMEEVAEISRDELTRLRSKWPRRI